MGGLLPAWPTSAVLGAGLLRAAPISLLSPRGVIMQSLLPLVPITGIRKKQTFILGKSGICLWIKQRRVLSFFHSSMTPKSIQQVISSAVSMVSN